MPSVLRRVIEETPVTRARTGVTRAAVLLLVRDVPGTERALETLLPGRAVLPVRREDISALGPVALARFPHVGHQRRPQPGRVSRRGVPRAPPAGRAPHADRVRRPPPRVRIPGLPQDRYSLGGREFTEKITFGQGGNWDSPEVGQAARLICLLAGVSYYKTAAPPAVDLGQVPVTPAEREFLRAFYIDGLGEFAYLNGLDLSALRLVGGTIGGPAASGPGRVTFNTQTEPGTNTL